MELNGKNFSEFKEQLSEIIIERIMPISEEIKKLLEDINFLDSVLLEGSDKADKIASKKNEKNERISRFLIKIFINWFKFRHLPLYINTCLFKLK